MTPEGNQGKDRRLWDFYQSEAMERAFRDAKYRLDLIARTVRRHISSGRVLDVGLGDGYLIDRLAGRGYEVHGLDFSAVNVEKLRGRFPPTVRLAVGNIIDAPYSDGRFDAVVASEVLEHLSDSDLFAGVRELHRCLKPHGVAFVTVPADEVLSELLCFCPNCGETFHRYGHKQSFSRGRLTSVLRAHGFGRITVRKFMERSQAAPWPERLKHLVKARLVNLPVKSAWLDTFPGRYLAVAEKS
jgi:SAM-dependent methyltransferase